MNKLRILVIDDEAPVRELICGIINHYVPQVEICGTADGVKTGVEAIERYNPDLVLLDVNLIDGTGFDILKKIEDIRFSIIFVTAYEQYALRAFRFSAIDYIMKPVNIDELTAAIQKAAERNEREKMSYQLKNLLDNINSKPEEKKIVLKDQKSIYIVKVSDIIRCEADHNYTTFHLMNGKQVLVSKTLKEYEDVLSDYAFIRSHQSHLVNINHMVSFEKNDGGYLRMIDGSSVPVSKRKKDELMDFFSRI